MEENTIEQRRKVYNPYRGLEEKIVERFKQQFKPAELRHQAKDYKSHLSIYTLTDGIGIINFSYSGFIGKFPVREMQWVNTSCGNFNDPKHERVEVETKREKIVSGCLNEISIEICGSPKLVESSKLKLEAVLQG